MSVCQGRRARQTATLRRTNPAIRDPRPRRTKPRFVALLCVKASNLGIRPEGAAPEVAQCGALGRAPDRSPPPTWNRLRPLEPTNVESPPTARTHQRGIASDRSNPPTWNHV